MKNYACSNLHLSNYQIVLRPANPEGTKSCGSVCEASCWTFYPNHDDTLHQKFLGEQFCPNQIAAILAY